MDPTLASQELLAQRAFLRRLARGLLGDDALAEDVVQDVHLRALERTPHSGERISGWLATVTRRLALNARRSRDRRDAHERSAARPESAPSHEDVLDGLDLQRAVLAAVRALDEPYRSAIWLRYYEDRSPAEIAARHGVPAATVKTRLRRALAELRQRLDRDTDGNRRAWAALLAPLARKGAASMALATAGGMLGMKKLAIVLLVIVAALIGWKSWPRNVHTAVAESPAAAEPVVELRLPVPEAAQPHATGAAREPLATGNEGSGSELAGAGATLAVHVTWERDGTDAAGIGLVLVPLADERPDLRTRQTRTDPLGRAFFEGLAPGGFTLLTDREGKEQIELVAGERAELELSIAVGVDVAGQVVDRDGRPVAGAEIWLARSFRPAWLAGEVVARADAAGRFSLRSVGPRQSLGAFASGFAPAWLEPLSERTWAAEDPRVELTLVLEREGATLEGLVIDVDGVPVPGALVTPGIGGMGMGPRGWGQTPSPRTVVTDALGRFRADGLEPGQVPVFVLAEGFALGCAHATVAAGAKEFVTVQLSRGVTIAGRVLGPGDQPVSGARIGVRKAGEVVEDPFSLPESTSAADGAFLLEHVPAGEITLHAWHASDARLRARSTRFVPEGATESWDIVLAEAPHISGRAVDGEGRALALWKVAARSQGPGLVSSGRGLETDDDGRFVVLVPDPAQAWTIELRRGDMVHDRVEDVRAGDEVVLVGRREEELGRVEGGFVDAGSRAREGERISARLLAEGALSLPPSVDLVSGRFAFEGVISGRYRVRVQTAGSRLAESEEFDLAPGATVDIGVLASRPAGSVVVEFVVPANVALPDDGAYVGIAGGGQALVRHDGEWRAEGLEAGHYQLATYFPKLATQVRGFEIQEGRETRLSVALERGVVRTLVFTPDPGVTCPSADVLVRGVDLEFACGVSGGERVALAMTLAPGHYEVEATTSAGLAARGAFDIADLSVEQAEITFELR